MTSVTTELGCQEPSTNRSSNRCGAATAAHGRCLAHLTADQREEHLASLSPGSPITACRVTFTADLVKDLLTALRDGDGRPHFGRADFDSAIFTQDANFNGAIFEQGADFSCAIFQQDALFSIVIFCEDASFERAAFGQDAIFRGTTVTRDAFFWGATFSGDVRLRCAAGTIIFSDTQVTGELEVEAATSQFEATQMRVGGRVSLRLRQGAQVNLADAVVTAPITLHEFRTSIPTLDESILARLDMDRNRPVTITSLRGTDADRMVLTDVDLSHCLFADMHRLDQLRLDGRCTFATDPRGTRQVLVEEHHWRAQQSTGGNPAWTQAPDGVDIIGPARIEVLYRQLRKALEDTKNEPAAADFYYGEMEMRRATAQGSNSILLWLYWASSGYALRALRALTCLALLIAATITALTLTGFPASATDLKAVGTLTTPAGPEPVHITIHQADPTTRLPTRAEEATEITLNAVIFRSTDTELTTSGRYLDITARILGPLFLGLALVAGRNKVKR